MFYSSEQAAGRTTKEELLHSDRGKKNVRLAEHDQMALHSTKLTI